MIHPTPPQERIPPHSSGLLTWPLALGGLYSPFLTRGDLYANFRTLPHSRSPFKMDNFLIIGSEEVKCRYASLEQINSRVKKKNTSFRKASKCGRNKDFRIRRSGFDALRFSLVKSGDLLDHPESRFLYSISLARVTVVYVKPHEDAWLWAGLLYGQASSRAS